MPFNNSHLKLLNMEKWIHWEIPICMNASKKLIHNKWETNKKWKFEFWDIHNFHNCCHMSSFFHVSFEILDLCHIHFRVTTNILRRCWNFLHWIEMVLNRHLSLFSLDLRLIIMQLKSNPPWWILFTTISLVSCFRYAFLFSK